MYQGDGCETSFSECTLPVYSIMSADLILDEDECTKWKLREGKESYTVNSQCKYLM